MNKYKSDILRSCHTDAEAMFRVGAIDAKRMHEYDVGCLVPSAVPNREASSSDDRRSSAPIPAVAAARA